MEDIQIARLIAQKIRVGDIVPCQRINSIIEDAYSQLGIRHKATSAELERWFECSLPFTKRINGKVTKVRKIERTKIRVQ